MKTHLLQKVSLSNDFNTYEKEILIELLNNQTLELLRKLPFSKHLKPHIEGQHHTSTLSILREFNWENTPQGYDFWLRILRKEGKEWKSH